MHPITAHVQAQLRIAERLERADRARIRRRLLATRRAATAARIAAAIRARLHREPSGAPACCPA